MQRFFNAIERAGNKLPHPVVLFAWLCLGVVLLSWALAASGVSGVHPKTGDLVTVRSLVSGEGLVFALTSVVRNFVSFPPLGAVLVILLTIGVADKTGLVGALMQVSVMKAPRYLTTFVIFLVGMCSHVAADAAFVILIPLSAMIFQATGRNPLVGAVTGFVAVGAGYDASLLITPTDVILSGITTSAAQTIDPAAYVSPIDNYYFVACSAVLLSVIGAFIIERIVEPLAGPYRGSVVVDIQPISARELKGLKRAGWAALVLAALVLAAVLPAGSPLRNAEGGLVPSPFLTSAVAVFAIFFLVLGWVYGRSVGKIGDARDAIGFMAEAIKELAPTLVLFFAISQFLAWFKWTHLGEWIAVGGSHLLDSSGFGGIPLVLAFLGLVTLMNLFITSGSAQWSLMAPIFVPMLMLVGFEPAFVQAAYRIADSSTNIVTPMSPYFSLCLAFLQRYQKDAGIGTLASMTIPVALGFLLCWTLFLILWMELGLPIAPGVGLYLD
ncbi:MULTISPECIES: AbgT family transporter [unclassified Pseudomonas]|uniref:AbgT family transporter n=1 Tax=unclassified Pseudomonas TaxID=196821 RepID=UPI0004D9131B|nr:MULTISPECIES: AbgT family transporter [unclassified Pseudomonas]KES21200.1 transporter [Pseudomonas sp. AAC]OHS14293.1 transporter [Pseudomonas sp. HMSC75E02]